MSVLAGRRLLALDVETTGWDPAPDHGVIEVAWVDVRGGTIGEDWSTLVGPSRAIAADAIAIHGIHEADLVAAPLPERFAPALRAACDDRALVFHNAAFDLAHLAALFRESGLRPLAQPVIDTLGLARGLFGPGENGLADLVRRLGLATPPTHRAAADARACAEVLLALAPRWERERGIRTLDELAAASQDALRLGSRRFAPTEWRLDAAAARP
jgi:DNA polymerase III epsilon subunit-like protein